MSVCPVISMNRSVGPAGLSPWPFVKHLEVILATPSAANRDSLRTRAW